MIEIEIDGKSVDVDLQKVKVITLRLGYWRKANAIHAWFVDNVQGDNDDCKRYAVSHDDLYRLLGAVNEVLADHDKAARLLPSRSGFFFGGTEYDEYYFSDLELTKEIVENALKCDHDIYYQSSW